MAYIYKLKASENVKVGKLYNYSDILVVRIFIIVIFDTTTKNLTRAVKLMLSDVFNIFAISITRHYKSHGSHGKYSQQYIDTIYERNAI